MSPLVPLPISAKQKALIILIQDTKFPALSFGGWVTLDKSLTSPSPSVLRVKLGKDTTLIALLKRAQEIPCGKP